MIPGRNTHMALTIEDRAALEAALQALDRVGAVAVDESQKLTDALDLYPGLFESVTDVFDQIYELEGHIRDTLKDDDMPPVWKT